MPHSASVTDKRAARWETLLLAGLLIVTFIPFLSETLFTTKGEPREAIAWVAQWWRGHGIPEPATISFGCDGHGDDDFQIFFEAHIWRCGTGGSSHFGRSV